jgi:alpha-beta hydrolase superfamily lysophospholipase
MSSPPGPQAIYLPSRPDPAFATLHRPAADLARDTAVLLCPPFGWDEICSYRSLRFWAADLAQAGYCVLRLTLPSTGDSGGDARDPDRLGAWVEAFDTGATWLREASGVSRLAAIGIGLGGVVAYLGAAGGAPVDDLVLWATPARGRSLVRHLRAFSKLEVAQFFENLEPPPPLPDGELEAGGFLLSAETVSQLEQLELDAITLPPRPGRRALVLERDGLPADAQLVQALRRDGVATVTTAPGNGYGAMTSHPQEAQRPREVIASVTAWLNERAGDAPPASSGPVVTERLAQASLITRAGAGVTETVLPVSGGAGALAAILAAPTGGPAAGLTVVLLNAGAIRHIGPSRMWVEAARRFAGRGVATVRLDVEGIGDADGPETPYGDDGALYAPELIGQVRSVLDQLQQRGLGDRFVLAGLCGGAHWSFHCALQDPRVVSVFIINPRAFIWEQGLGPARDLRALLSQRPSWSKIRRVATRRRLVAFLGWVFAAPLRWAARLRFGDSPTATAERDLDAALAQFADLRKRTLLVFTEHEPFFDELEASGRLGRLAALPQVTLERIAVRDHTLRANWSQGRLHAALDAALQRELSALPTPPTPGAGSAKA